METKINDILKGMTASEIYDAMNYRQIDDIKPMIIEDCSAEEIVDYCGYLVQDDIYYILDEDHEDPEPEIIYKEKKLDNNIVADYFYNLLGYQKRDLFCDILGINHLSSNEEILEKMKEIL